MCPYIHSIVDVSGTGEPEEVMVWDAAVHSFPGKATKFGCYDWV